MLRRPLTPSAPPMRLVPALLVTTLVLVACDRSADARRAAQLRYDGHTLEEWWQLRRDPNDETAAEAQTAMRMLGAEGVPFLAIKAASADLGDVIGASTVLENMCPGALPAMEAARGRHPSPALDIAIRRVRADSTNRVHSALCAPSGAPVAPQP